MNLSELIDFDVEITSEEQSETQDFIRHINPKVLFRRIYRNLHLPFVGEMAQYMVQELLLSKEKVLSAIETVLGEYEDRCDDNLFSAIITYMLYNDLDERDISFFTVNCTS